MSILPVLDLMQAHIVRAVAGRRDEYRPIESKLAASAQPLAVARALREQFGFSEFYLADLDAIRGGPPDLATYQQLQDAGMHLWIDAGVRTHKDRTLKMLIIANADGIVVGLESIATPEDLAGAIARVGPDRVIFSLDLQAGRPLGNLEAWRTEDPFTIAARAVRQMGVRRLIVLDLARVGVGQGIGTEELCVRLKSAFPQVRLLAGGGVASMAEVRRLETSGVDQVLVASALHDGRITAADVNGRHQPDA